MIVNPLKILLTMSLTTDLRRIKYIDDLIRRNATGNLESLAKKLHLSKSHTVNFLNEMRKHGFPIKYSRKFHCYYYSERGNFNLRLFKSEKKTEILVNSELTDNDLRRISGGKTFSGFFVHTNYIRMSDRNFVK